MSIIVSCPSCEKTLNIPDKYAGKRVKCPACQNAIPIPANEAPSLQSAPATSTLPPVHKKPIVDEQTATPDMTTNAKIQEQAKMVQDAIKAHAPVVGAWIRKNPLNAALIAAVLFFGVTTLVYRGKYELLLTNGQEQNAKSMGDFYAVQEKDAQKYENSMNKEIDRRDKEIVKLEIQLVKAQEDEEKLIARHEKSLDEARLKLSALAKQFRDERNSLIRHIAYERNKIIEMWLAGIEKLDPKYGAAQRMFAHRDNVTPTTKVTTRHKYKGGGKAELVLKDNGDQVLTLYDKKDNVILKRVTQVQDNYSGFEFDPKTKMVIVKVDRDRYEGKETGGFSLNFMTNIGVGVTTLFYDKDDNLLPVPTNSIELEDDDWYGDE